MTEMSSRFKQSSSTSPIASILTEAETKAKLWSVSILFSFFFYSLFITLLILASCILFYYLLKRSGCLTRLSNLSTPIQARLHNLRNNFSRAPTENIYDVPYNEPYLSRSAPNIQIATQNTQTEH